MQENTETISTPIYSGYYSVICVNETQIMAFKSKDPTPPTTGHWVAAVSKITGGERPYTSLRPKK